MNVNHVESDISVITPFKQVNLTASFKKKL